MHDDKLIQPPAMDPGRATDLPVPHEAPAAPSHYMEEAYYPDMDDGGGGLDLRRYLVALLRHKWLVLLGVVLGCTGAYFAWTMTPVTYTAEGNLWIQDEGGRGDDVTPIRASGLLESNEWIELLRSYQVLDTVAVREGLRLSVPPEFAPAFERFELAEEFLADDYRLRVSQSGADFTLTTAEGALVQQATFGVPIGENVGFIWNPAPGSFEPEADVRFTVSTARDAALELDEDLLASMDQGGSFLSLRLAGSDGAKVTGILNSLMDRHVAIAAELKRSNLDEILVALEEQLSLMSVQLTNAERELEEFKITTISLPSDQSILNAPGLAETRDPVFGQFFDMKVQVEQLRLDREQLEELQREFAAGEVRIEALEVIPAAAGSSELRRILTDLVETRSELRTLSDRYSNDYAPIQDLLAQIETIEQQAIPRVVTGLVRSLQTREGVLSGRVRSAQAELQEIPPRTIEESRLERHVATTTTLYNDIRGRVEAARLAAASAIPDVRILDVATIPTRPTEDRRLPFAAIILFGCIGAAMAGAILLDHVDAKFRYASDVSRDIGLDILGSIPRIESGAGRRGVLNAAQALEAFRELRIHVGFAYGSAGPIVLAITSPSEGEGKSLISSNLAVAFSEVGKRTLFIDGDTRRGDAHTLLGRQRSPGLIDYLRERTNEEVVQATDHPNLDFIGSGSRGVSTPELLASPRMAYFMGTLKRAYDVIIVDCPPLASGGDPLILGSLTGNLAVVIRTGATERALAQAKLDQLARLPIRILGAILNDVSQTDGMNSYYASYLASYEPLPEEGDDEMTQLLSTTSPEGSDPSQGQAS